MMYLLAVVTMFGVVLGAVFGLVASFTKLIGYDWDRGLTVGLFAVCLLVVVAIVGSVDEKKKS